MATLNPPRLGKKYGPRLTFQFEGLELIADQELSGFNGLGYNRSRIDSQQSGIRYNFQNTPIVDGPRQEAKHVFAFDLWLDEIQMLTLEAMVKTSNKRFKNQNNGSILLLDYRQALIEETRTRARVAGTPAVDNSTIANHLLYFAQFSIFIPETPELFDSLQGNIIKETTTPGTFERRTLHLVPFTATELDVIPN